MALHNTIKVLYPITDLPNNNSYFSTLFFFTKCPIVNALAITEFTSIRNIRISIFKNFRHFT